MRQQRTRTVWDMLPVDKRIVDATFAWLTRTLDEWELAQARADLTFQQFIGKLRDSENVTAREDDRRS